MIANSLLGYGVVKTLSYMNEPQDIHPANTTSQLTTATSLALSPPKCKAHGMFSDDNISTEIIVLQDQIQQQEVLLLFIIISSLNLRAMNIITQLLPLQNIIILQRIIKVLIF